MRCFGGFRLWLDERYIIATTSLYQVIRAVLCISWITGSKRLSVNKCLHLGIFWILGSTPWWCRSWSHRDKGGYSAIAVMYFTFRPTAKQVSSKLFYNWCRKIAVVFSFAHTPQYGYFFGCNSVFKYYLITGVHC